MGTRAIALLSGGLDSATLLYYLQAQGYVVEGLAIDYGQRHAVELAAAGRIAHAAGSAFEVVNLRGLRSVLTASALTTDLPVPHGHYEEHSMRQTVVPNRNMVFVAVAVGCAAARGADVVAVAIHAGDHAIYPDCRPAFVDQLARTVDLALGEWWSVRLLAPFVEWRKAAIVRAGAALGVPFELTWSCYEGGAMHCGRCGTCVERHEAFALAGVTDPTPYAHRPLVRGGAHGTTDKVQP